MLEGLNTEYSTRRGPVGLERGRSLSLVSAKYHYD